MNILEIFGIVFVAELGIIVTVIISFIIGGYISKINTRRNYLDIIKLDGSLRKKQMEYFEKHPEEYEKWKKMNNQNPENPKEIKEKMKEEVQKDIDEIISKAIQK